LNLYKNKFTKIAITDPAKTTDLLHQMKIRMLRTEITVSLGALKTEVSP